MTRLKRAAAISIFQALTSVALLAGQYLSAEPKNWQTDANADPVLQAMLEELDRSKAGLKLDQVALPYYIEYHISDLDQVSAEATFGALNLNLRSRFRILRVVVRIGDYKQDSYFGQGEGTIGFVPVDGDNLSLRHALWLTTDKAYKAAAQALTAKQAQLKQFTVDQPVDDFARAGPVHSIAPLATLDADSSSWNTTLQKASALYVSDPQIEEFDSSLQFSAENRYFVNSEGTVVRSGRNFYEVRAHCGTQAQDGLALGRTTSFVKTKLAELPSAEEFVKQASEIASSLKSMRDAPLIEEEYRGPVLFSAHAGAIVFTDLIGANVLGQKPALGKNGRTTGAFSTNYKTRVLPDFFSVEDDPTLSSYAGHELLGAYGVDDEGVPAQRVPVVEKGVLVNYLLGRTPIRDFPNSNGHGRARMTANAPVPSLGNLLVHSTEPLSPDDLKKKFLELCRQRELPYCYRVETVMSASRLEPNLLYRAYPKDGHEELVRGATFGDLDTRSIRTGLVAAGSDVFVESTLSNAPHSVAAPSLLFDELEIKRASVNKEKLPEYPAPPLSH